MALMISESLHQACDFQNDLQSWMGHNCTLIKANIGAVVVFAREKDRT